MAAPIKRSPDSLGPRASKSNQERERKFLIGDRVCANGKAPAEYRERVGFVTEIGPGDNEYRVEFDDGAAPTTGYLLSSWLGAA